MPSATLRILVLFLLILGPLGVHAQSRIPAHPSLAARTRLTGHTPAWASPANDAGPIAADLQLDHLSLLLSRPPAVEAAFQQLLRDQQDPASPRYHQWLTPAQATLYAVPEAESDAIAAWLQTQGLHVDGVSPNRLHITFSGPASTVASALNVEFHRFRIHNALRYAATSEPEIPAAFASVIQGFVGLAENVSTPHSISLPARPVQPQTALAPDVNVSGGLHWLAPADFARIYDINSVYNAGINGVGERVAIIGASHVAASDISGFESLTGVAQLQPNTIVVPGSTDPGTTGDGWQAEATLDVDRVLSTAPGAGADLVLVSVLSDTNLTLALQYDFNALNDPVLTMSFGRCEAEATASIFNSNNALFAQAVSQGISIFVSSGDSDATACENDGSTFSPSLAVLSTNYLCTPNVTCVGGTQFSDTASPATYWSSTNGVGLLSALSYIPEGAWNEPTSSNGVTVTYVVQGTGGGTSSFASKPAWQTGTGVPADGARDTPDVSFSSSGHNAYLACLAIGGGACPTYYGGFGGTSAAAPSMAAITALADQKLGRQGLLNPMLYKLAAVTSTVFHDATPATSGVATCSISIASTCNNTAPGASGLTGGANGFALTTGYDLATGLGSIDVANLLTALSASPATSTTVTGSALTIAAGQTATFTASVASTANSIVGAPTGTVQFAANGVNLGAPVALTGNAVTPALAFSTPGTYTITAAYSGNAFYASSTGTTTLTVASVPANSFILTATPIPVFTSGAGAGNTSTVTLTSGFPGTGTFALSCAIVSSTGPYYPATCSMAPASLTVAANASGTSTLTIATATAHALPGSPVASLDRRSVDRRSGTVAITLCALLLFVAGSGRRRLPRLLALAVSLSFGLAALSGCGSSTAANTAGNTPTNATVLHSSAGTYTVTVTGTSGTITNSTSITVTVN
jgi:subtilase family serine protease